MKKTISLIVVFLIGGILMPGCYECTCPDVGTISKYADVDGLGSFISKKATSISGLTGINANDKIHWDEIESFSVLYSIRTYGHFITPKPKSNGWGTSAYACSCAEPGYLGSKEKLSRMTVKTVFDFDAIHPAGSTVDELVTISSLGNEKSLKDYLSNAPISYNESSLMELRIAKTPTARGPFALDIKVELDNGEIYATQTLIIQLQ